MFVKVNGKRRKRVWFPTVRFEGLPLPCWLGVLAGQGKVARTVRWWAETGGRGISQYGIEWFE